MSITFEKPTGGGVFFKAKEHLNDLAILLEPKRILKDQPNEFEGVKSLRDEVVADVTIFRDQASLDKREPSEVMQNAIITGKALTGDVEKNGWIGKVALVTVAQPKRAYVWRTPEVEGVEEAVGEYYEKREAEVKANLEEVPDFD